jgi:hypothetical protein
MIRITYRSGSRSRIIAHSQFEYDSYEITDQM